MIWRMIAGRRASKRLPKLPEGVRIYAIGDVHGRADLLDRLISRIETHLRAHPVVRPIYLLVGDYIDRGPNSRQVVDMLISLSHSRETVLLRGNHDLFVKEFLLNPLSLREWSKLGGLETLMSYGLKPPLNPDQSAQKELADALNAALPMAHRHFFDSLRTSFSCGRYFFAHAGVRPGISLANQQDEDLMCIREDFLLHEGSFGKIVVHGHTPVREIDIRPNRINIDTGAYATGRLSCLVMEKDHLEAL
jgi:serine/threonine protein phosphatase 1